MSTESTERRVAVITGASSGIGEATARAIEGDAVATELVDHITQGETKQAISQFYDATSITAVSRPRSVSLNEILVRPTTQAL